MARKHDIMCCVCGVFVGQSATKIYDAVCEDCILPECDCDDSPETRCDFDAKSESTNIMQNAVISALDQIKEMPDLEKKERYYLVDLSKATVEFFETLSELEDFIEINIGILEEFMFFRGQQLTVTCKLTDADEDA